MKREERERLCAALRSTTGWLWSPPAFYLSCVQTYNREWWLIREHGPVSYLRNADGLDVDLTVHAAGRGWPERLAAAVAAKIKEASDG